MASQVFVATNVLLGWKSGQTHQGVQEFPLSSFHLFSFSLIFMTFWKGENHKWCLGFLLRMVGGTMLQSCLKWMQQHRLCVKMLPGQLSWGKPPRNVYWSLNPNQCNQVSCFPIRKKIPKFASKIHKCTLSQVAFFTCSFAFHFHHQICWIDCRIS